MRRSGTAAIDPVSAWFAADTPGPHQEAEGHAHAAAAVDLAQVLMVWRATSDLDRAKTALTIRASRARIEKTTADLTQVYRQRALPCQRSSGHRIDPLEPLGDRERFPEHGRSGEALFAAAVADCEHCCTSALPAAADPETLTVLPESSGRTASPTPPHLPGAPTPAPSSRPPPRSTRARGACSLRASPTWCVSAAVTAWPPDLRTRTRPARAREDAGADGARERFQAAQAPLSRPAQGATASDR